MSVENDQNNVVPQQLTPVVGVSWSRSRAWHGETVTIQVRTSFAPDGTLVDLEITTSPGGAAVATVANRVINGGVLDHAYTLDWRALPAQTSELYVVTGRLTQYPIASPPSPPLTVDVVPPMFSA
jgi:hypothetical protein